MQKPSFWHLVPKLDHTKPCPNKLIWGPKLLMHWSKKLNGKLDKRAWMLWLFLALPKNACQVKIVTFSIPGIFQCFSAVHVVVVTNTETLSQIPSKISSWTQHSFFTVSKKRHDYHIGLGISGICAPGTQFIFSCGTRYSQKLVVQAKICENGSLFSFISPLVLHE